MIKYYKELEKPSDFILSLVDRESLGAKFMSVQRNSLPLSFFEKYGHLLRVIKDIDFLLKNINLDELEKKLKLKSYLDEFGRTDMSAWINDNQTFLKLYEIKNEMIMPNINQVLESPTEIARLLRFYQEALLIMVGLIPEIEEKWKKMLQLFSKALQQIETLCTIKYREEVARDVTLSNEWYITSFGDIYNANEGGHKEATLYYPWNNGIKSPISEGKSIEGKKEFYLRERSQILKNGFIYDVEFQQYFNYNLDFPCIQHIIIDDWKHAIAYESRIVKAVLGVVSAEAGFYSFFEDMQKYTNNPKEELEKLIELTNEQISDILVRCAGFYKIETSLDKTITTSSLSPFEDLHEYLKRGWNVCIIPPIIIDRENGVIKALDMDSLIVERYIERGIKKYKEDRERGYGKVYQKFEPSDRRYSKRSIRFANNIRQI